MCTYLITKWPFGKSLVFVCSYTFSKFNTNILNAFRNHKS